MCTRLRLFNLSPGSSLPPCCVGPPGSRYEIEEVQSKSVLDSHFLENQMRDKLKEQEEKFARAMEMQKRKHMALEAQLAKHKVQAQDDRSSQDAEHVKLTQKMESEYVSVRGYQLRAHLPTGSIVAVLLTAPSTTCILIPAQVRAQVGSRNAAFRQA